MDILETILKERPLFHKGETEIERAFTPEESKLSAKEIRQIENNKLACYGIEKEVLLFLLENVTPKSKTLETGAGYSTLIFAYCGASHTAVTPSLSEITLIKAYAHAREIQMSGVDFVQQSSDSFLPTMKANDFDIILLDGKHAFPWPVIDWFYTADKLKLGGLMIIDDAEMKSVSILVDFMKADPGWKMAYDFSGKTIVFKKTRNSIHDVAWHMQPYTYARPNTFKRFTKKIKQIAGKQ